MIIQKNIIPYKKNIVSKRKILKCGGCPVELKVLNISDTTTLFFVMKKYIIGMASVKKSSNTTSEMPIIEVEKVDLKVNASLSGKIKPVISMPENTSMFKMNDMGAVRQK
jgi:hypothetical protein